MLKALSIALLVFNAGCAVVGTGGSGPTNVGTGIVGDSDGSTTDKLAFAIEQTETPVSTSGRNLSVRFDMDLQNATDSDVTIRRISLETIGSGPVTIRETRWNYDKKIKPGEVARIEFWAQAEPTGSPLGFDAPMITRSTVLFSEQDSDEATEALFTRRVSGRFAAAIAIP